MSSIIPFDFQDESVRVIVRGNNPWFVGKDVCRVLGLNNHHEAMRGLDADERGSELLTPSAGGRQEFSIISESGLYSLIFRSRKPEAKAFKRWVTSEVLPAIRKTGTYATNQVKELEAQVRTLQGQVCRLRTGLTPRIRVTSHTRDQANLLTERLRENGQPTTTRMEAIDWAIRQALAVFPASRQTTLNLDAAR